jgi:hypothetical protein
MIVDQSRRVAKPTFPLCERIHGTRRDRWLHGERISRQPAEPGD